MPGATIRASYILESNSHGSRETYFFQYPTPDLNAAFAVWDATVPKRQAMLAAQGMLKAIELSVETLEDGTPVLGDSLIVYKYLTGTLQDPSANFQLCLLGKLQNATRVRRRNCYIRCVPDDIEIEGGRLQMPQGGSFKTRFDAWRASLLGIPGGVGYIHATRSAQKNLVSYAQNVDGTVTITGVADTFSPGLVGKKTQIRVYTARTKSQISGQLVVQVDSTTACTTVNRIAVLQQPTTGWTISTYTRAFEPCIYLDPQKVVERNMGKPLLEPPGKRPARARI